MAEVVLSEGKGYLRDPSSGMVISVPEAELASAIDAGFVPTTAAETAKARTKEHYGEMPIRAGLAGLARGATFGLSDVALTKSGMVAPESLAGLKEGNPAISSTADIIGGIGSIAYGGPAALLGKGAAKAGLGATSLAARALGTSSTRALPRLAGSLTEGGIFGGAIGAGGAISDVALDPEQMSAGEVAARVLGGAGKGIVAGAGLGTLGWLARTGAASIKNKYTLGIDEIRGLRVEKAALEAERTAMQASGEAAAPLARLEAQIGAVGQQLHDAQVGAVGKVFSRAAAYGLGHAIGGGLTGGLIGVIVAPRILKTLQSALVPAFEGAGAKIAAKVTPFLESAYAKVAPAASAAWEKVAPYAERALATPIGQVAVEMGAAKVGAAVQAGGARASALLGKLGRLGEGGAGLADAAATGAMIGGIPGAAIGAGAHVLSRPIGRAVEGLTNKVAPAARLAAIDAMTSVEWKAAGSEIARVDPMQAEISIRALLPESTPPEVAEGVTARVKAALGFLQTLQPAQAALERVVPMGHDARPELAAGYQRAFKAVVDPGSMLVAFADNKLTPEQVQAWQAVYPEALAQVRAIAAASVAQTRANGGRYDRARAESLATLLGDPQAAPPMARAEFSARIQAMHASARGASKGPGRPRNPRLSTADNSLTTMQRIGAGRRR